MTLTRIATAADVLHALMDARLIEVPAAISHRGDARLVLTPVGAALVATHETTDKAAALTCFAIPGLLVEDQSKPPAVAPGPR